MVNRAEELIACLEAEIVKLDARVADLESTKLHREMVMLRTDRDRLAAELKYTIAAYVTGNKPSAGDGVNWKAVAGEQKAIIEGLQDRLNASRDVVPDDVCLHGIRSPHECRDCAESQSVPYGWVEPIGGVFVDNFTKMCMRDSDAANYSLPLYAAPTPAPANGADDLNMVMIRRVIDCGALSCPQYEELEADLCALFAGGAQ